MIWLPILADEFQSVVSHCELCDEDFHGDEALRRHEAEHQTCGLDGCNFTAHPKVIITIELNDYFISFNSLFKYYQRIVNTIKYLQGNYHNLV